MAFYRIFSGFIVSLFIIYTTPGAEKHYSELWGRNGEKWTPKSRLPDFSYAGYHSGEKEIPEIKIKANVRDFGAAGDGKHDDSQAFIDAVAATENGAIFIPEGRYKITKIIEIKKSNIVLRGAGTDKTVLYFPVPLNDIKPNWGSTTSGKKTSNYSWSGGIIWFKGRYIGKKLANIAKPSERGGKEVTISRSEKIKKGDKVIIYISDDKDKTLFSYLYSENPGDFSKFRGNIKIPFIVSVTKIKANQLFFDRPLRSDIRLIWKPQIKEFTPTLQESGIENLSIEFPKTPYRGHFSEKGYNAVAMDGAVNCWVKNIRIKNADSGIFLHSAFCTIDNLLIESERKPRKTYTGHHGVELCGVDNICKNFEFRTSFIHDLGVSAASVGNVYSTGKGVDLTLDHHKRAPYENLYTELNAGKGTRLWHCGGGKKLGKNCAARGTFWNIKTEIPQRYPPPQFGPDSLNFTGINTRLPSITEKDGKWFEALSPVEIYPQNIYKAQIMYRIKKQ
jgi:hypothetical protein